MVGPPSSTIGSSLHWRPATPGLVPTSGDLGVMNTWRPLDVLAELSARPFFTTLPPSGLRCDSWNHGAETLSQTNQYSANLKLGRSIKKAASWLAANRIG